MKLRFKVIILALAVAVPVALFTACAGEAGDGAKAQSAQKKTQKYTCPMHPNYVVEKPGDCPVCGMSLVPVEESEDEAAAPPSPHAGHDRGAGEPQKDAAEVDGLSSIKVSPEKQRLLGVKTARAEWKDVAKTVRTVGRVAYDPELYYAEQEYLSALGTYAKSQQSSQKFVSESAKSLLDASRMRLQLLGLSDAQIQWLEERGVPDKALLLPANAGRVWVYASIYEDDVRVVKVGQNARVSAPKEVTPETFSGEIVSVDPVLDPQTRSARARILVEHVSAALKPEVYLNVEIRVPLGRRLVIPADAVMDTGTRQVAFVEAGEGVFQPREVGVDFKSDGYYAVNAGIAAGEKVVVNANFLIDSESQLKATMKRASGASGGHKH